MKSENNAHTVNAKNAGNFEKVATFLSQSNKKGFFFEFEFLVNHPRRSRIVWNSQTHSASQRAQFLPVN